MYCGVAWWRIGIIDGEHNDQGSLTVDGYRIRQTTDASEWNELFARVPLPHLYQSWAFGEAKRNDGFHPRRLIIERAAAPAALCQVLEKRVLGVRLVSRINRGPLLLSDELDVGGIYHTLRQRWCYFVRGPLLLAPALTDTPEHRTVLRATGFRERRGVGWPSAYLDLNLTPSDLRKNLTSRWRNHLSVSERRGLTMRVSSAPDDVAWLIERHVDNMRQKDFVGPTPKLLHALQRAAREDVLVCQAMLDGAAIGGALIVRFGQAAEYYIGWYSEEGRKNNAGNYLVWQAVLEMQRRGCRLFDLGGVFASGRGVFKQGLRGIEYRLAGEWITF